MKKIIISAAGALAFIGTLAAASGGYNSIPL